MKKLRSLIFTLTLLLGVRVEGFGQTSSQFTPGDPSPIFVGSPSFFIFIGILFLIFFFVRKKSSKLGKFLTVLIPIVGIITLIVWAVDDKGNFSKILTNKSEETVDNTTETPTNGFDKEKFLGAELTYSGTTQIGDDLEEYTFEFFHLDGSRPTVKINSKFEAELTKDANGDYYLTSSELAGGKFQNVGSTRMTYITNANQVFGSFYKK